MPEDYTREYLESEIVGQMKAVTIPVDLETKGEQRVLQLDEVERLLRNAEVISQQNCDCREKYGKCIEPLDGCLSLNEEAREMIEKGKAKEVTVEEALASLKRTYDAGLVHMAYTMEEDDDVSIICSCCTCCCHSLAAAIRFGYENHAFPSEKVSAHEESMCVNCGVCAFRCQTGARHMEYDVLVYDADKCFGCGLCLECPQNGIQLVDRVSV